MRIVKSDLSKKYITFVAVMSPLLAMYSITISTICFLDVAILIGAGLLLLEKRIKSLWPLNGRQRALLLLIILIVAGMIIAAFVHPSSFSLSVFLRTMRFVYYLTFIGVLMSDDCFDTRLALRMYEFLAVLAAVYLLLQYFLLFVFSYSLPGYFPFLPLMREELATYTQNLYPSPFARPRSIFAEPSQIGLCLSGYLGFSVIYNRKEKWFWEKPLIVIAMIITGSTTAVLTAGILTLFYLLKKLMSIDKKLRIKVALTALLIAVALVVFVFGDRLELLLLRFPTSLKNRIEGITDYLERAKAFSLPEILFGIGMNTENMSVWYSGLIKIPLYFGVIGSVVFLTITGWLFWKASRHQRLGICLFLLMSLFSEMLVSNWLILYLPFVVRDLDAFGITENNRIAEARLAKAVAGVRSFFDRLQHRR